MTDEELKMKCTERAKIFQQAMESCKSTSPTDCIEWFADRIAELEKMLAEQYPDLKQSLDWANEREKELEAQITDMKNYCCEVSKYLHDYSGVELNSPECRKRDILLIKELKLCEKWGDLR